MAVYLIHFETPYKHARHYLGSTHDLQARLQHHQAGTGARLMEVVSQAGISFHVSRTWQGGRDVERTLKGLKNSPQLCPTCLQQKLSDRLLFNHPTNNQPHNHTKEQEPLWQRSIK
jgi:predicted GIY-YIG superfamily endonuclease